MKKAEKKNKIKIKAKKAEEYCLDKKEKFP